MNTSLNKVLVKYNGKLVGYLVQLENEKIAFQYDDEWIESGFSISPFSLPLDKKIFISNKDTFNGLYGVFRDSLPDGWGDLIVSRAFAKKGINYENLSELVKLTLISENGLGALYYEPAQSDDWNMGEINLDQIAEDAKMIFSGDDVTNLDEILSLGGSSGGARPKAHILIEEEEWIIKFPCHFDPDSVGEKEYIANMVARNCGIKVNEFKLFDSKVCSGYFGAKRFDRNKGKRIHVVSLSSLLETSHRIPTLDYIHLFQVINKICVDKDDMYEAYRRMCFNVFYGNKDDHGKNFSFLYDETRNGYKLSPAYDTTKTLNKVEHEMTVNGNGNPTEDELLFVRDMFKLSVEECSKIIEKTKRIIANK